MYFNRFWSSVVGVGSYLFGVGLLLVIVADLFALVGVVVGGMSLIRLLLGFGLPVVAILATRTYLDWKWGWRWQHVGIGWSQTALVWLVLGLLGGGLAGLVAHSLSALLAGGPVTLGFAAIAPSTALVVLQGLLTAFMVEMAFRGVVVSRYQSDLPLKELLLAAILTPFAWILLATMLVGRAGVHLSPAIDSAWTAALSVFLTLLFMRTGSVWLSFGLRAGLLAVIALLNLTITPTGGLLLWGTGAAILLFLEWQKLQGTPRRPSPVRSSKRPTTGKTIRGPWGPH